MNNIQRKKNIVLELTKKLADNHFYITDSQGLNVSQVGQLRKLCHKQGVHYQVVKNTLLARTFSLMGNSDEVDYSHFSNKTLKGNSSVFITQKNPNSPAKIIKEFQKSQQSTKPLLKGALVNGELYIGSETLDVLTEIKSKEVLLGELVGLLKSPVRLLANALDKPVSGLSDVIKALLPS